MKFELSAEDRIDIADLLRRYCLAIVAMDANAIGQFWDRRETELYYIAEEVADPMIGWDDVARYWENNKRAIDRLTMRTGALHMHAIADDLAIIMFPMHWNAALGSQPPVGGDVNVTAVLRHTAEGWRFIHYTESASARFHFCAASMNARSIRIFFRRNNVNGLNIDLSNDNLSSSTHLLSEFVAEFCVSDCYDFPHDSG